MTDKPIPFSAPMVCALLGGRKTQTRRLLKPQPSKPWGSAFQDGNRWWTADSLTSEVIEEWRLPYAIGDRLWVREHWKTSVAYNDLAPSDLSGEEAIKYLADDAVQTWGWDRKEPFGRFRPGMFMPRWASRLTLHVTDVRVERLQSISEADALAEGAGRVTVSTPKMGRSITAREGYQKIWTDINGPGAWDANPWVVAVSFTVQRGNIDEHGRG